DNATTSWSEVHSGGTLLVDNFASNLANRLSNRRIALNGGTFRLVVNASTAASEVSTRELGGNYGLSVIQVDNPGSQASTLQWLHFNTLNAGSTYDFRGALGTATNMIRFGSGATFTHTAPSSRTSTTGIIPRATVNGTEWATYDGVTGQTAGVGIRAFTAYSAAANILSASSAAVFRATPTTANSLSGNQTLVALNLNTDGGALSVGGLGGLNPSALTLSSGSVLVNGSGTNATLAVPIVSLGAVEGLFHVASDKVLTVTSGITGSAGLTKNLSGSVNFDGLQFYTGTTSVNDGTLRLMSRASNTLLPNNNLQINGTGVLDLNGGSQFVAALYSQSAAAAQVTLGGSIINSDNGRQAVLVVNPNNSFSGRIQGDITFVKAGTGGMNFHSLNDYVGQTIISGGNINLQDAGRITATSAIEINRGSLNFSNGTTNLNDRVNDAAPITMKAGTLNYAGQSLADVSETLGAVSLVDGLNQIFADDGNGSSYATSSAYLTLTSLTRPAGSSATLRFNNLGDMGQVGLRVGGVKIISAPTLTNGLLGPWAIIDRVFASFDPVYGIGGIDRPGFPGYSGSGLNSLPADTDNVYTTQTGLVPLLANTAVGTLSINTSTVDANYNLQGNTLRLRNGGLIMAQNNGNTLLTVGNGNLTAGVVGSAADLYVWHAPFGDDGRRGLLSANVVDNSVTGPVRLIVSGADGRQPHSALTLSGTNTNSGGTVINASTIYLDPAGRLGTGGLVINGGVFRQSSNNALFRLPGLTTVADSATVTTPAGGTAGLAVGMPIWGLPGASTANMYITAINAGANTFTVTSGTGMTASTTANPYILTNAYSGNGGLIPEQTLTMAGGAQAHLTGANRLSTLTFDNGGGGGIVLNAGGVLPLTGGIVATSTNATASAVIGSQSVGSSPNGVLDLNASGSFSMNVAAASVAGRDIAPLTPTLIINSNIQNGGIAKSGNGLLQLGSQNTFTGGVNATAGGLVIGASTVAVAGGFTGPFGDGVVTMASGMRLLASAANLSVQNVFTFGESAPGVCSIVCGGLITFNLTGSGP
ncbi:MAG: beta strand repeat-containing protein, partial [Verrucomicrobiota bacterium]